MRRMIRPLLFLSLLLGACSPRGSAPLTEPGPGPTAIAFPSPDSGPATESPSDFPSPGQPESKPTIPLTPHIDQPPDGNLPDTSSTSEPCGYMWATQNLTDLTLDLQAAIKSIQPEAQAYAYAFGEDCVYQDGRRTFIAMETDFNVTVQVADLTNESELGEWIVKTMQVIGGLPAEKIVGPRPGKVTMVFVTTGGQKFFNFYVDKFQALDPAMSGWEVFQALKAGQ